MKSWLMMNKVAQFLTLQRLPQELPVRDSFPPSRTVVCSKLLFVCVACREGISTLRVGVIVSFSNILRRCHHPTNFGLKAFFFSKMKKFRQNFFETFQTDWAKKNESIDKCFLGRLQNKDVLQTCKQKLFPFFWRNSNLFKTLFFAGILVFIEWLWKLFWNRVRSNFSPKVTMPYVSKWHSYKSYSSWLLHETYFTQVKLCCKEFFSTNKQLATFIDQSWQPNPQHKYWLF